MGLLTVGHGTATAEELAQLVRGAGIEAIVDVRAFPKSRRRPHFSREAMERWIPELAGSAYRWEPNLGGFRTIDRNSHHVAIRHPSFRAYADYMETEAFERAFADLLRQTAAKRVAVLCSETLWWRCHRRLIADAAVLLRDFPVDHLMHDGKTWAHVPTAGVRVLGGNLRYDVLFEADRAGE